MKSDISLQRLQQFPPLMWVLLFGSFITRGSYYMVWPFLTVILYEKFSLTATEVGGILSLAAVLSVFVSFVGSSLSDKFGRKPMIFATGLLYIVSFSLLAEADSVAAFTAVITLCSIATSLWRPLSSALVSDILPQAESRELAMQALYFAVNLGCAVGPLIGIWLGLTGEQSSFRITVVAFAVLLVLLMLAFKHQEKGQSQSSLRFEPSAGRQQQKAHHSSTENSLSILCKDRLLQCLIVANMLCLFIYAQMDSSLIQYLTRAQVPDLLNLISAMLVTNAVVIICCQFVLLKMMASYGLLTRIRIGLVILMLSQLCFAFNPLDFFIGWIGAVIIISLAETILFPSMNVHIDRIAPEQYKGAYFGATAFYDLGFALAPVGGGVILDLYNGTWLFVLCAGLAVAVFALYHVMDNVSRPRFITEQLESTPPPPASV